MADVKIIDIDSEQWNIKDQEARNRITTLEEKITKNFIYSTDEVDTGEVWIDNKKIFRKVFIINAVARSVIPTGLPSGSEILKMWVRGTVFSNDPNSDYSVTDIQFMENINTAIPFYTISQDGTRLINASNGGHYVKDITIKYTKPTN